MMITAVVVVIVSKDLVLVVVIVMFMTYLIEGTKNIKVIIKTNNKNKNKKQNIMVWVGTSISHNNQVCLIFFISIIHQQHLQLQ